MFNDILDDSTKALNLTILLSLSPTFLKVSTGPRAFELTPRVFGELTTLMYFLGMYQFYLTDNFIFYFVSALFGSCSFLSSKFSVQVVLIFSIIIAVFLESLQLLSLPVIAFLIGIILSNGRSVNLIKQQFSHLYKYATELKDLSNFIGKFI